MRGSGPACRPVPSRPVGCATPASSRARAGAWSPWTMRRRPASWPPVPGWTGCAPIGAIARGGHPLERASASRTSPARWPSISSPRRRADVSQADWLRAHGIDELVEEGRAIWRERAAIGDLEAMQARSRVDRGRRPPRPGRARRLPRPRVGRPAGGYSGNMPRRGSSVYWGTRPASKARMASGRFSVNPSISWLRSSSSTAASRLLTSRLAHSTSLVMARP